MSGNTADRSGGDIANGHRGGAGGTAGGEVLIVDSTRQRQHRLRRVGRGDGAGGIGQITTPPCRSSTDDSGTVAAGGRGGGVYSEALSGAAATVNIGQQHGHRQRRQRRGNLHNSGNGGIAAMRLRSTIVSAPRLTGNCGSSGNGDFTSVGYNLADDNDCRLNQATDQPGTNPLLAPLALGEGSTAVHVPAAGSPAIDRGTSDPALPGVAPLTADQRGLTRPVDVAGVTNAIAADGTDVGAVEVQPPPAAPSPGPVARDTSFALRLAVAARPRIDRRRVVSCG